MSRLTKRCPQCDRRELVRDRDGHVTCRACGWRDTWSEEIHDGLDFMDRNVPSLYSPIAYEREAEIAAAQEQVQAPAFQALLARAAELRAQRLGEAA